MILYEKYKPLLKRVPTLIDTYEDVQKYDTDNLYPQRCEEIIARSYTLKSAIEVLSDFLNGDGFIDDQLNKLVVNEKGAYGGNLGDLLRKVCFSFAKYNATALHIGYDLNYRISSITPIPFEYCRLGIADDDGYVDEIRYSTNWEQDYRKSKDTTRKITSYHVFNPDPEVIAQQIADCDGIENYKGQILYWTPEEGKYPKSSFDPVFEHAQAQYEASLYKVSALQNGFSVSTVIVVPETNSMGEQNNLLTQLQKKKGSAAANGILGIETNDPNFDVTRMVTSITPPNVDRQWEYTDSSSLNAIMENYAMPKELLGVRPENGMFNKQNMQDAYIYFNTITRNKRNEISRFFSFLMQYWQSPIQADFKIKEQQYAVEELQAQTATVNSGITKLSRKEFSNFRKYVADFQKGTITKEQALTFLRAFGLSEEEIALWLDNDPTNDPNG